MAMTAEKKQKILKEAKNVFFVALGCLLLAFTDAVFLVPRRIVHGGVDSISIILEHILAYNGVTIEGGITDIAMAGLNVFFWLLGLIFFGWKFAAKAILGTILFPLFYSIFLRTNFVEIIGLQEQLYTLPSGTIDSIGVDVLAGIFGGFLCGLGVGLTFLGNGSSGGVDVIALLIAKYTSITEDVATLIVDGTVVILGLCFIQNWPIFFIGIITAYLSSLGVNASYLGFKSYMVCEIITDKYEEIQAYIHTTLDHGSTLIDVTGGYTGAPKKMLKVVIHRRELTGLKNRIASIDPKAFVAISQAKAINGEGFDPLAVVGVGVRQKGKILRKMRKDSEKGEDDSSEKE